MPKVPADERSKDDGGQADEDNFRNARRALGLGLFMSRHIGRMLTSAGSVAVRAVRGSFSDSSAGAGATVTAATGDSSGALVGRSLVGDGCRGGNLWRRFHF